MYEGEGIRGRETKREREEKGGGKERCSEGCKELTEDTEGHAARHYLMWRERK